MNRRRILVVAAVGLCAALWTLRLRGRGDGTLDPAPRPPAAHDRHGEPGHGPAGGTGCDGAALRGGPGPERQRDGGGHGDLGEQRRFGSDGEFHRSGHSRGQWAGDDHGYGGERCRGAQR